MRRNEPVSKIMTSKPTTVHLGQKLSDARTVMTEHHCHHVPVVNGDELIGMLSSTDLLRASYEYGEDVRHANAVLDHTRSIEDVMQKGIVTLGPKDSVRQAAEIFGKNWFHALPVCEDGKLVGIVTTTDVMNYLVEQY